MCRDLPAGHSQARSVGVPICDNERHKEISEVEERDKPFCTFSEAMALDRLV